VRRGDVVAEARKWIGIPYRPKGRSERGLDCIGLLIVVGRAFAVPHEDQQHYTDYPTQERQLLALMDTYLARRRVHEPWDGLIGVFSERRLPAHVGIFARRSDVPHLIHARLSERKVVEEAYDLDPLTRPYRLLGLFAYPGLED
jgi:cell wall-associated NlpC family hydrolase